MICNPDSLACSYEVNLLDDIIDDSEYIDFNKYNCNQNAYGTGKSNMTDRLSYLPEQVHINQNKTGLLAERTNYYDAIHSSVDGEISLTDEINRLNVIQSKAEGSKYIFPYDNILKFGSASVKSLLNKLRLSDIELYNERQRHLHIRLPNHDGKFLVTIISHPDDANEYRAALSCMQESQQHAYLNKFTSNIIAHMDRLPSYLTKLKSFNEQLSDRVLLISYNVEKLSPLIRNVYCTIGCNKFIEYISWLRDTITKIFII
ncbi:hypothetical protein GJ496_006555 [Pomphorhynchus laevis]|nr:hypothetical protein GJ496_006555 [Pomphorhynchus laevis]